MKNVKTEGNFFPIGEALSLLCHVFAELSWGGLTLEIIDECIEMSFS